MDPFFNIYEENISRKVMKERETIEVAGQTVIFGNSESMPEIPTGTVDLIFTSPPYWNLKDYDHPSQIGQESYDEYLGRLNIVWQECYRVAKSEGVLVINVNHRRHEKRYYPIAFDIYKRIAGWKLLDILIWYIPNALPQPNYYINKLFDNKFEHILILAKNFDYKYCFNKIRVKQKYRFKDTRVGKLNILGRCLGNVFRIPAYRPPNVKVKNYHISAFPEELAYLILSAFTNVSSKVLDPFLGSGTVLKVAKLMGLKGVGYEINDNYGDVITAKIKEDWEFPPFESLDLIHSIEPEPGNSRNKRRK